MPSGFRLFENRVAVAGHLEATTSRWNHLDFGVRVMLLQLSCQTDSSGPVVSKRAVFDS